MSTLIGDFQIVDAINDGDPDALLDGGNALATFQSNGRTFVYVASYYNNAIQVLELGSDGTLAPLGNIVFTNGTPGLQQITSLSVATVGANTYLIASGNDLGTLSTYQIGTTPGVGEGLLTHVETEDTATLADSLQHSTVRVGNRTFVVAVENSAFYNLTTWRLTANGQLTAAEELSEVNNPGLPLTGLRACSTFQSGGSSFVLTASNEGVALWSIDNDGQLALLDTALVNGQTDVRQVVQATVGGQSYVFAQVESQGIGTFTIESGQLVEQSFHAGSDPNSDFNNPSSLRHVVIEGRDFLVRTYSGGFGLYSIGPDGSLTQQHLETNVTNPGAQISQSRDSAFVVIDGVYYLITVSFFQGQVTVSEVGGKNDTLTGTADGDLLMGVTGNDSLGGNDGSDTLQGYLGNDTLDGGEGADLVEGGAGTDSLLGGNGDDTLVGGGNGGGPYDRLTGGAGADSLVGSADGDQARYDGSVAAVAVNLTDGTASGGDAEGDTLTGIDHLAGSAHGDSLTGDGGGNLLEGLGGNDRLYGGAGDDTQDGGDGKDSLYGSEGADSLIGGAGKDYLDYQGSAAAVTIDLLGGVHTGGDAGGDTISGIEMIRGSVHNDSIAGDNAANQLDGGGGSDLIVGKGGNDKIYAGQGDGADSLDGESGNDLIQDKSGGENLLWGGDGSDSIYGGRDNDAIFGGSKSDTLAGNRGDDELTGNAGRDTFVYGEFGNATQIGNDTITDFDGKGDRIDLRGFDGPADFDALMALTEMDGGDAVMTFSVGNSIRLTGFHKDDLSEFDFLFAA